ncbi:MAG: Fe(2+)-trafficking protein [Phycisphaerales bacterium]|nr:Fe(2+)-trafficking protein [Phycisphaerales bacterium]
MDLSQRIAQFENMAQSDPENEMAHFSLGGAYAQAGRHTEAAESFLRCAEIVPGMSKALQLAAENFLRAGDKEKGAAIATRGYMIAAERGDVLPKGALAEMLKNLGKPIPVVAPRPGAKGSRDVDLLSAAPPGPGATGAATGSFVCTRTGQAGSKMARPPFRGPIGEWIGANISAETWDLWIRQGTKVINELRLDLSREQDEQVYDQHMREYLGIDDGLYQKLKSHAAPQR